MAKLSKSHVSKKYLAKKSGKKSKPISQNMKYRLEQSALEANKKIRQNNRVYEESNAHSNDNFVTKKFSSKEIMDNLNKMKNPHTNDYVNLSEKGETIEDYSAYQEKRDLERYKKFLNSFAYDDITVIESECSNLLILGKIKKSTTHEGV